MPENQSDMININVGGQMFTTTSHTLAREPDSVFNTDRNLMIEQPETLFYDRDPTTFRHILNYLRTGKLKLPAEYKEAELLLVDAYYYKLFDLVGLVENRLNTDLVRSRSSKTYCVGISRYVNTGTMKDISIPLQLIPLLLIPRQQHVDGVKSQTTSVVRQVSTLSDENQPSIADNLNIDKKHDFNLTVNLVLFSERGHSYWFNVDLDHVRTVEIFMSRNKKLIKRGYYQNAFIVNGAITNHQELIENIHKIRSLQLFTCNSDETFKENVTSETWHLLDLCRLQSTL